MFFVLLIILLCPFLLCDGFAPSTLVKTPHVYQPIGTLQVHDNVICCDIKTGKNYSRPITAIKKSKSISYFVRFSSTFAIIGYDQLVYIPSLARWIPIQKFLDDAYLKQQTLIRRILPLKSESLISLTVDEYHNFYVTEDDILVHNAPAVFIVTTATEALLPTLISGAFLGTAATYLGIKSRKRSRCICKQHSTHQKIPKKEQPPIASYGPASLCDASNNHYFHIQMYPKPNTTNLGSTCPKQPQPESISICPAINDESTDLQTACCIESPIGESIDDLEENLNNSTLTMGEKLKPKGYKSPENPRSNANKKKHGNSEERYKNNPLGRPLTDPEA